jgi:ribonuclease HII
MQTIGKITKDQIIKSRKRASREMELEANVGWASTHKVHASQKDYNRKPKHRNKSLDF